MQLSNTQLQKIDVYIDSLQIRQLDIRLELQDHIASILENKMISNEDELKMSYVHYEIKDLVRELKYEIKRESIRELFQVFKWNLSFPNIFIVLFLSTIVFGAFLNLGFRGAPIEFAYGLFTMAAYVFYRRQVRQESNHLFAWPSGRASASDLSVTPPLSYRVEQMKRHGFMPLLVIAGIALTVSVGAQAIYDIFFGGAYRAYIGSMVSSILFGLYFKVLYDTFATIPNMIKEEISLEELTSRLELT